MPQCPQKQCGTFQVTVAGDIAKKENFSAMHEVISKLKTHKDNNRFLILTMF